MRSVHGVGREVDRRVAVLQLGLELQVGLHVKVFVASGAEAGCMASVCAGWWAAHVAGTSGGEAAGRGKVASLHAGLVAGGGKAGLAGVSGGGWDVAHHGGLDVVLAGAAGAASSGSHGLVIDDWW